MSLMGKVCCGTNHSAFCDCLPSSISVYIPAWSYTFQNYAGTRTNGVPDYVSVTLSCTERTVTGYKCCYKYQGYPWQYSIRPYGLYRINAIPVGTLNVGGPDASHITNAYFSYAIAYGWAGNTVTNCNCIYTAQISASNWCNTAFCLTVSRDDLATNSCGGITNDLICNFNNFHSGRPWLAFYKPPIYDCSLYSYSITTSVGNNSEHTVRLNTPCGFPSSTPINIDGVNAINITVT